MANLLVAPYTLFSRVLRQKSAPICLPGQDPELLWGGQQYLPTYLPTNLPKTYLYLLCSIPWRRSLILLGLRHFRRARALVIGSWDLDRESKLLSLGWLLVRYLIIPQPWAAKLQPRHLPHWPDVSFLVASFCYHEHVKHSILPASGSFPTTANRECKARKILPRSVDVEQE